LGLARNPVLREAAAEALARSAQVGSTGSRLLSGNSPEWNRLEVEFADFAGSEAALYFGSGYAANIGLLSAILTPGDTVFSDALNHASIIDGARLSRATKVIYPHCDVEFLEHALRERVGGFGAKVIVTETIFSMDGNLAPLEQLLRLARDYGAELVLDEAHATGVRGPQGRGIAAELDCVEKVFGILHACGKALASAGAFVCCSKAVRAYLINRARSFIFSTAMPPPLAGQIRAALALVREADGERKHLRRMAETLLKHLVSVGLDCGMSSTQIVPIILGKNETAVDFAAQLSANGFAVKAIRPPTVPAGTSRVRLSLTSEVSIDDVGRLVVAIDRARGSVLARFQTTTAHG
jgi:8-amino-7-oxononanoate synthase